MNTPTRKTLAVLVDNEAGVLSRVVRLFSGKGYNIESLAVGTTDDPAISRITIEILASEDQTHLISSQLRKLICVHSVKTLNAEHAIRSDSDCQHLPRLHHRRLRGVADPCCHWR